MTLYFNKAQIKVRIRVSGLLAQLWSVAMTTDPTSYTLATLSLSAVCLYLNVYGFIKSSSQRRKKEAVYQHGPLSFS